MVDRSMLGLASKSNSRSDFCRGNPASADAVLGASAGAVVAFGHQQLGQEPAVAVLFTFGVVGEPVELGVDGGQPQHAAVVSIAASEACPVSPQRRGVVIENHPFARCFSRSSS